jgi:hypothetical protein
MVPNGKGERVTMSLGQQLAVCLHTSRPGLWLVTLWVYLMPTGGMHEVFNTVQFWVGLFYCCLPLNLLVYAWNDLFDFNCDKHNPRKQGLLVGSLNKVRRRQLRRNCVPLVTPPPTLGATPSPSASARFCGSWWAYRSHFWPTSRARSALRSRSSGSRWCAS